MGEVIRKGAALADILADVRATRAAAETRGGTWASLCASLLAPEADAADHADAVWQQATEAFAAARITRDHALREAALAVGRCSDTLRDALGRPVSDPDLERVFPGGQSRVFRKIDGCVRRIDIAADQVERVDRIAPAVAEKLATELRSTARRLATFVHAVDAAEQDLADASERRTRQVRATQVHLSRLKKGYRAHGFTEVDIHRVIPDRPTASADASAAAGVLVDTPLALVGDDAAAA